jgi:hypothetical protein
MGTLSDAGEAEKRWARRAAAVQIAGQRTLITNRARCDRNSRRLRLRAVVSDGTCTQRA